MNSGNAVDFAWTKTRGAEDYISTLYLNGQRKQFGLLEKPSLPPQKIVNFVKYKIFLCGKYGTGKSSTISNLLGNYSNVPAHTPGIQTGLIHWPVRLVSTGQILFFSLTFWDAGDTACKKFEHILPACIEDVDCIMFTFAFNDRQSYNDISQTYANLSSFNMKKEPLRVVLGTKSDQYIHSDISDEELESVREQLQAKVLRIRNVHSSTDASFESNSQFLNSLCNLLWLRDEELAASAPSESN